MPLSSETDEIVRAAAGDRAAIASLVRRHGPHVQALAARLLRDVSEAEDVTQDVFIRAWKVLPDWRPEAKFSTWLYRVTFNLSHDRLRKRRERTGEDLPDIADSSLGPEAQLDQIQRVKNVEAAIGRLPERQAAALLLCSVHGASQAEAAEALEISQEALESLLARARRGLKAMLAEPASAAGSEGP